MKARFKSNVLAAVLLFLCTHLTFFPAWGWARAFVIGTSSTTAPSSTALPSGGSFTNGSGSISTDESAHYLQVNQDSDKAIVSWSTFDIGSASTVYFKNGTQGITLNRIGSSSASKIFGTLTADGNVYLVNTNGILFGKTAKVNLRSLVASSLDISDDDFLNDNWNYQADGYTPGDVANYGTLTSTSQGRIMLLGGNVENGGTISADGGEVILGAATEFKVTERTSDEANEVTSDYSGTVTVTEEGQILADVGEVGIYGKIIRHNGKIQAMSTVERGSRIELVATESITTGSASVIDSGVTESEEVTTDSPFDGRYFQMSGPEEESNLSDSIQDSFEIDSPITITLYGDIEYPSGDLTIDAGDGGSIYIGSGANIDLSGSWETREAIDQVISAQLNSEELRDEETQSDGYLLGQTIYVLLREGSNIGNLSEHLENLSLTALEQSAEGGLLKLYAGSGKITVADGASIDISGGGTVYEAGYVQTTVLISSDGDEYEIAEAPDYLEYVDIINPDDDGTPNNINYATYVEEYVVGADAGTISLVAKQVIYEGSLSASATIGQYQVNDAELTDDLGYTKTAQTTLPESGTLQVGISAAAISYIEMDPVVQKIVIMDETPSLEEDDDRDGETWLSDDLLSDSGLGQVYLYATESVTIQNNAQISLAAGGSFTAKARRITHGGEITVPSGTVSLTIADNKSSKYSEGTTLNDDYIDVGPERIELSSGSVIDVSGEAVTESEEENRETVVQTNAGSITLSDSTVDGEGVVVLSGSELNLDGGYHISDGGSLLDAGDAGTLSITGASIILDGSVSAISFEGQAGGTINLSALSVSIVQSGQGITLSGYSSGNALSDAYAGQLVLEDGFFEDTGIANINISAAYDLVVGNGVTLEPSLVKLTSFGLGKIGQTTSDLADISASSVSLTAGSGDFDDYLTLDIELSNAGTLTTGKNASITVSPGGSIALSGKGANISGTFTALAGTISLETQSTILSLYINSDARFYAMGYNRDTGDLLDNNIVYEIEDAGTVSLLSGGALVVEEGVVVNVSGSTPVTLYKSGDSYGELVAYQGAAEPGSVELSYEASEDDQGNETSIEGSFYGYKYLSSLRGASFSLESSRALTLTAGLLDSLDDYGFDSLTLASDISITFDGSQTIDMERQIIIDTPVLSALDADNIVLNSAWIQLENTEYPGELEDLDSGATLTLNAEFIDITGDIRADGFADIYLNAEDDIRLTDTYYLYDSGDATWSGLFKTTGDLTLTSARTYTTTGSWFTLKADGDIYTEKSGTERSDPIYSAYGWLTVEATNIYHNGVLAAPNGKITLTALGDDADDDILDGRVYLGSGSELSVAGSSVAVEYGEVDDSDLTWYSNWESKTAGNQTAYDTEISEETLAEKTIDIEGLEVITDDGASINLDGDGVVFGYTVVAGLEGSYDPLSVSGTYVIIPGVLGDLPGEAIYLEGNDEIAAGIYTILPDSYAFLEGAIVIEYIGTADATNLVTTSAEGYSVVIGHEADKSTGLYASQCLLYTVRSASDVLSEVDVEVDSITTGDAGSLTVDAPTTVLNATISAQALSSSYTAGTITLSGTNITVGASSASLGSDFSYSSSALDSELIGKLYVNATRLSEGNFWSISLGSEDTTKTITLESGAELEAEQLTLVAQNDITLEAGASIQGIGDDALVSLTSTQGSLIFETGSSVASDNALSLDLQGFSTLQNLSAQKSISITSDTLCLVDGNTAVSSGLIIEESFWSTWGALEEISLTGTTEIVLAGTISLEAQNASVTLDTPNLVAWNDSTQATISAQSVTLEDSQSTDPDEHPISSITSGQLTVSADDIYVGNGNVDTIGFGTVSLNAVQSVTFLGSGSLTTNNGDLLIDADVVTGAYTWVETDDEDEYEALDFTVDAGTGQIVLSDSSSEDTWESNDNIGGSLTLTASRIENATSVNVNSGLIYFIAEGTGEDDGIYINDGGQVLAKGSGDEDNNYDGGTVVYESSASVVLSDGSLTDVSAGSYGDAGTVMISNPDGTLSIASVSSGTPVLLAQAQNGDGGTFIMDTLAMSDISSLANVLSSGGFTEEISLRMRTGDVFQDASTTFTTHAFKLSVDEGNISINGGAIDASGEEGGSIELYAGGDITLDGASLLARGTATGASGGEVVLASGVVETDKGVLTVTDSTIDLSAGSGGTDGTVYLRAARDDENTGVNINLTGNQFTGISQITVEGVARYNDSALTSTDVQTSGTWFKESDAFMDNESAIASNLLSGNSGSVDTISIVPGVEVYYDGDMTVSSLDLSSWRFGAGDEVAAVLTLKASGNLTVTGSIKDAETSSSSIRTGNIADSTTINLSAGAALSSSDIRAVETNAANPATLTISNGSYIYTESGDINFASAGDTVIGSMPSSSNNVMNALSMSYNMGSYAGVITGYTGGNLQISGGVIQTATGDIELEVGEDLLLDDDGNGNIGTIRTIGEVASDEAIENAGLERYASSAYRWYDMYDNGGGISISAGGDVVMSALNSDAWDTVVWQYEDTGSRRPTVSSYYGWAAAYGTIYDSSVSVTQGIAAMAGGDVNISCGGDFYAQTGTFGEGDLTISARGDINGRYLNYEGACTLESYSNIGNDYDGQVIEAFDSQIAVTAQGNITLAGVVNPTLVNTDFNTQSVWNMTYSEDASVTLTSAKGSIYIGGNPDSDLQMSTSGGHTINTHAMPGTLAMYAAQDIVLQGYLYLAPSSTGNLTLVAGNDITGTGESETDSYYGIYMSDADPDKIYGLHGTNSDGVKSWNLITSNPTSVIHEADYTTAAIYAGNDILNIVLDIPKSATIKAGRNIGNMNYTGQNLRAGDVTTIFAGRDIYFDAPRGANAKEEEMSLTIAGPGLTVIQAGNSIDLGESAGIQLVGSGSAIEESTAVNSYLPEGENTLLLAAGVSSLLTKSAMDTFFDALRQAAIDYSAAISDGDDDLADEVLAQIRENYIDPIVDNAGAGEGNISLVNSTIYTSGGSGSILMFATGTIDVGLSSVDPPPIYSTSSSDSSKTSGIFTRGGGDIKLFASGDINVNQSRVMTFDSGDIDIWSDHGDINAGMGSTVAYASSDTYTVLNYDGTRSLQYNPPATGSGIRATATSTDELGDVYATAPDGIIDAGEAGIAGNNVTLAALEVLNVQNISVTGVATGFTPASDASASVSGLSGSGSVADNSMMNEQAAALAGEKEDEDDDKKSYSVEPKWVSVEVTEFEDNDQGDA
nr:filamentous haemagglutinin family protein [uncultured Desulfobacter sp.]